MTWIEDGTNVLMWREILGQKYSDLPGVRKLHDFLFIHSHTGKVVMKVRELCHAGDWNDSTLKLLFPDLHGISSTNYQDTQTRMIKDDKMAHMVTMYDKFISPDRRPSYLPAFQPSIPNVQPIHSVSASSSALASRSSNSSTTRQRKQSKCSVPGCDGSGHRNHAKWNEGHRTRAGCPILHAVSAQSPA